MKIKGEDFVKFLLIPEKMCVILDWKGLTMKQNVDQNKRTKHVSITVTESTMERLVEIQGVYRSSMSQTLRNMIDDVWELVIKKGRPVLLVGEGGKVNGAE